MAQILVRDLPKHVLEGLKRKAARQGLSLEAYLRQTLCSLAKPTPGELVDDAERIAAMSPPIDDPELITKLIREDRDR